MILDFSIILIVSIFIFAGYKRGLIRSIYGLLSLVIAGILSVTVSKYFSLRIYDAFYRESVNESVNNSLSKATADIFPSAESIFNNLPLNIKSLFSVFKVDNNSLMTSAELNTNVIVNDIQNIIMNAVVSILQLIITVIVFVLLLILLKVMSRSFLRIFDVPVIKQINGAFGLLFGLVEGLAFCYIAILIIRLIFPISNQQIISSAMIDNSLFFNRIYYSDFLNFLSLNSIFAYN